MLINKPRKLGVRGIKKVLAFSALAAAIFTATLPVTSDKAQATATILLPGQIAQASSTVGVISQYAEMVQQWENAVGDLLAAYGLDQWVQVRMGFHHMRSEELHYGERVAVRLMQGESDPHSGQPLRVGHYNRSLLNIVVNDSGQYSDNALERILPPPIPPISGELEEQDINSIRDHARLLSMESYTEPAPARDIDSSYGMEYELARISYIQQQLLAQDSIKQYPMHAGLIKGQTDKATTVTKGAEDGTANPATLLSLQVVAQAELNGQTSLAILESSLRQERLLGALLAIKAKEHHLKSIDMLNQSEFP